ncbi:tripartite tricarboxylate transporter TctA [Thalassospira lucentensis]|jgi:putative tricarboxylic transport membrane protein|uniref:Tripartite tricarboxylate transporter TctA n=2 Tax=Thalassospira TaxID=168934 RepID=A0A154L8L0_9PROT|nr:MULTISPECIES: tripartite tricarboxylate transporter permease [Thalassospira]UKV14387.1 tripartite tricarboxylate transporter permease [Thalassospiraceae bacterium SW-3-3]KZB52476.1 tripartite tricarboxylate transporter TctA [Thalassospira xiamenensis]KZB66895.1 tripartite tricarboxylate transporter TctA [Thalassospira lucentensis]MAZ35578.1 tripartite tricarboxylate transporter TctA [Thalassospira sp.]MBO9506741.1 tripartite tricarboxylate transporter permease [Thalassospira sp. A3_1]|tara:strand:- start:690 stop:2225 length:1536 start_codon:yes stop_codon:yes gene_type:complete
MLEGIFSGLTTAIMPINLLMVVVGCFAGTFIGMLPGLGPITAIALMIPITYGFDPSTGLILMAGVYYGAIFGGSTSSILINAPGVAGTVATAFDGYPMAQQGKAGKALAIAAYSSFSGGTIAAIFLLVAAPALASVSLSFQSADYFALMVLGLTAVSAFAGKGQVLKAITMTLFGIMLSTIGTDPAAGVARFTFGSMDLVDGISFLLLAMSTFALSEALLQILRPTKDTRSDEQKALKNLGSMKLSKDEVKTMTPVIARSSVLGFFTGVLPGAGATIASFLAYGLERNLASAKEKLQFGKGSIRGLTAPETANNAACSGSFVPLLTLGIPGSGTTAVMMGALISYGVQPGPRLFVEQPDVFWSVIISMYIGNIVLLVLNLPLIPYISRLLALPQQLLVPFVLFFSLIGVYLVTFNTMDIHLMVLAAAIAIGLRLLNYPMAPMLLGFILGEMMEENLRRALMISDGSISFLWERPITLVILLISIAFLLAPLVGNTRQWLRKRKAVPNDGEM